MFVNLCLYWIQILLFFCCCWAGLFGKDKHKKKRRNRPVQIVALACFLGFLFIRRQRTLFELFKNVAVNEFVILMENMFFFLEYDVNKIIIKYCQCIFIYRYGGNKIMNWLTSRKRVFLYKQILFIYIYIEYTNIMRTCRIPANQTILLDANNVPLHKNEQAF